MFHDQGKNGKSIKLTRVESTIRDLPMDPGLRTPIIKKDEIRQGYLLKFPYQLKDKSFPYKKFRATTSRRFNLD